MTTLNESHHSAYVKRDGDRWIAYCTTACDEAFTPRTTRGGAFLDSIRHRPARTDSKGD